jgi:hypothetical protein
VQALVTVLVVLATALVVLSMATALVLVTVLVVLSMATALVLVTVLVVLSKHAIKDLSGGTESSGVF